jgi:hypothetical protein
MSTSIITPEVINQDTSILEESPMTEGEEKELVIVKTAIASAYSNRLEQDIAIGAGLTQIFRRRLYRGKDGGRKWDDWLKEESAEMTGGRGTLGKKSALWLRGFYRFRCEVLTEGNGSSPGIPLPASPTQIRPLIGQLETHPEAAVEMWKAACADASREKKGKVPTHDQVQRAYLAHMANQANAARRISPVRQEINKRATEISSQVRAERAAPEEVPTRDCSLPPQASAPAAAPSIPAWEIQKDDDSVDAAGECKRITQAINDAHKAIGLLRGILYSQINKYGKDYMDFLRQVDAGVYSLNTIDNQVQQMGEDIDFITDLLVADVGEGELSKSTIDITTFPTKP